MRGQVVDLEAAGVNLAGVVGDGRGMDDDIAQLRAEQDQILALPGRVAWVKLARLNRTAKILRGNAKVLLHHLKRMDNLGQMLATTSDQQAFEAFLDETERHLHNYVAAAQSRVEHFRQFARDEWPQGSPLREEYQRRVDEEFAASPLHNFVTDLRNLILHVRLPVSTTTETWAPGGAWTFRVMLDSADLLRWDGWSPQARQYIEASGKSVDLGKTVSTYTDEIIAFDRWVAERFIAEHPKELESYQVAVSQHQARMRQLGLANNPETP
jgi:hypothetical protein